MRKGFWIAGVLAIPIAISLIPVVHLSGAFPNLFSITSRADGNLRTAAAFIERHSEIRLIGYWEFICLRSANCEWIDAEGAPEFILYPDGLVQLPDGPRVLPGNK